MKSFFLKVINSIKEWIKALPGRLGAFALKQLKLFPGRLKKGMKAFGAFCFKHAAFIAIALGAILVTGFILLIPLKIFYRDRLFLNTWVNSDYCAGYDRAGLIERCSEKLPETKITIVLEGGITEIKAIDYISEFDYTGVVNSLFEIQDDTPFYRSFSKKRYHLAPDMLIKPELNELWEKLTKTNNETDYSYYFSAQKGCYVFRDSLTHVFDKDKAYERFLEAFMNLDEVIDLTGEEFFYDVEPSDKQAERIAEFEKIDRFQNAGITYDMGDERIVISPKQMCSVLKLDKGYPMVNEMGSFVIDEEKISELAESIFEPYNTIAKDRVFETVSGKKILTSSEDYGTEINMTAEVNYLKYALRRAVSGDDNIPERVPVYNLTANNRGLNDIGYDYIEVDKEAQKLYLVSGGECILETDITTGREGYETPSGLFSVSDMQRDRFLIQYNYSVYVEYEIRLSNGIYITDAMWRDDLKENDEGTVGSFGNIELDTESAKEVYEAIDEGVPVIVYGKNEMI